ncbi:hypothetical protein HYX70_01485 [Candidatus Saccharibacteria bacterium]|nr:hypothetical protein [Candidatus Saccharibacteria bacterium]
MKALIFTDKHSSFNTELQSLLRELSRRHMALNQVDVNSRDGSSKAQLYDIFSAPAVVLTRDDGAPVASWRHNIPRADDVSYQMGII